MAEEHADICRVCRCEAATDNPLFYPCVCTGSIKFVHQECLVQWLRYSKKEYCELCKHKFHFTPIYSADMPKRLPIYDIAGGLLKSIAKAFKYWFHYTLVAVAWLGVVPLTACRICRGLFTGSVSSLLSLPMDMLSAENILSDALQGTFIVMCSLCVFISLVWLREQLVQTGIPQWLNFQNPDDQEGQAGRGDGPGVQPVVPMRARIALDAVAADLDEDNGNDWVDADDEDGEDDALENEDNLAEVPAEARRAENVIIEQQPRQQNNVQDPLFVWDRADELTWERLLGLDGSLVFLEHVFWVISLNTLFVLVFAFCPYHIGQWTINGLRLTDLAVASKFEGVLTTMIGYMVVAICLVNLHWILATFGLNRARVVVGLCYIVVKVTILIVGEIGIFPLICGWWLDICSLPMFNATLKSRIDAFHQAPGTTMFVHWLIGMVYVFYFASFILLLREILRPGVLWFLRNVNDPEFNPINEMIHIDVYRHTRRFVLSLLIFGSTVMLMLWLPIKFIRVTFPGFLPYHVGLSNDAPINELSLELLLLQVVLPSLLDQGHTRNWLKYIVKLWTKTVAWLLDLGSYLLGNEDIVGRANIVRDGNDPVRQRNANNPVLDLPVAVGEAHQALLNVHGPVGFEPYYRPSFFYWRLSALIVLMCASLYVASVVSLILPVFIGRNLMRLWMPDTKVHELYTAACGLYVCWLSLRATVIIANWIPMGFRSLLIKLQEWVVVALKVSFLTLLLIGLVPLLIGLLFEQIFVVPLRVPLDQSPVFFLWQDWALGVLHTKILCGLTMMGPQWWLRQNVEELYNNGLWNLNVKEIVRKLCYPVILSLSLALSLPYIIAKMAAPVYGASFETANLIYRRIYPTLFGFFCIIAVLVFNFKQFKKLYEHIKNDKYLVGRKLVNYDRTVLLTRES